MKINELPREDVFRTLVTSEEGLGEEEAGRRLAEFGPNAIRPAKTRPLALRFAGQFTHFLAVLLWVAAGLSFLSEYLNPGEGMLHLGVAIVGVVVINAVFTFIQEYRAEKALEALKKLLPFRVTVRRDGQEREIAAEEVVPGDVVLLAEGDKVPADLRLIGTSGLRMNNASFTGESEPGAIRRWRTSTRPSSRRSTVSTSTCTSSSSARGQATRRASGMCCRMPSIPTSRTWRELSPKPPSPRSTEGRSRVWLLVRFWRRLVALDQCRFHCRSNSQRTLSQDPEASRKKSAPVC